MVLSLLLLSIGRVPFAEFGGKFDDVYFFNIHRFSVFGKDDLEKANYLTHAIECRVWLLLVHGF